MKKTEKRFHVHVKIYGKTIAPYKGNIMRKTPNANYFFETEKEVKEFKDYLMAVYRIKDQFVIVKDLIKIKEAKEKAANYVCEETKVLGPPEPPDPSASLNTEGISELVEDFKTIVEEVAKEVEPEVLEEVLIKEDIIEPEREAINKAKKAKKKNKKR